VIFGVLTPTALGCDVVLANAGHPPPVLIRGSGAVEILHLEGGQVVGVLPTAFFRAAALHLAPGDTLLLYTDGLVEGRVDHGARYDEKALQGS
jgi:phosphoserine phosphatase RsbU/P